MLSGEGEAALTMSEAAHQILRQQNVEGYAPIPLTPAAGLCFPHALLPTSRILALSPL